MENPPRSQMFELPPGMAGTRQTLAMMKALANQGSTNVSVRQAAVGLTMTCKQKDWLCEVQALHAFVRDRIRYVRDIQGVETLHTADRVLANGAGDCDDKSILLAAMLKSLSHGARYVAVGFNNSQQLEHVFVQAQPGGKGKWISAEATEPVPLGWDCTAQGKTPKKTIIVEV